MTISRGFGERMSGEGIIITPQCHSCKHSQFGTLNCEAFPHGIPQNILVDAVDHKNPVPGDHGIQFEPKTKNV